MGSFRAIGGFNRALFGGGEPCTGRGADGVVEPSGTVVEGSCVGSSPAGVDGVEFVDSVTSFEEDVVAGDAFCTLDTQETVTRVPLLPEDEPSVDAAAVNSFGLDVLEERDRKVLAAGMAGTRRAP